MSSDRQPTNLSEQVVSLVISVKPLQFEMFFGLFQLVAFPFVAFT